MAESHSLGSAHDQYREEKSMDEDVEAGLDGDDGGDPFKARCDDIKETDPERPLEVWYLLSQKYIENYRKHYKLVVVGGRRTRRLGIQAHSRHKNLWEADATPSEPHE